MIRSILVTAFLLLSAGAALPQTTTSPSKEARTTTASNQPKRSDKSASAGRPTAPAKSGYVRPDADERARRYFNSLFGPVTLAKQVAYAGIGTWRNSPEEWGDKWEGFGRRVASNFGKNAIKQTTIYGLDEAFKLDSRYYRSRKNDFGSKLTNALISPVTARNKEGKRVFGFPRIAGTYAAGIIAAETWYPDRYDWKDGIKSGTMSLGFNAAFNLVKEFIWK